MTINAFAKLFLRRRGRQAGSISAFGLGDGTTETFGFNDQLQMNSQELKKGSETLQKYAYGYGQLNSSGNLDTSKNNGKLAQIESWMFISLKELRRGSDNVNKY